MEQSKLKAFPIKGIGKQVSQYLSKLDIYNIYDLLLHLPKKYQDRTRIQPIKNLRLSEEVVIEGEITEYIEPKKGRTKALLILQDDTSFIPIRFFHLLSFQKKIFKIGTRLRCFGTVRLGPKGYELFHPEFKVFDSSASTPPDVCYTPIYSATTGLSQHQIRKLIRSALDWLKDKSAFDELLSKNLLPDQNYLDLKKSIELLHAPPRDYAIDSLNQWHSVLHKRLIFEELLAHRLSLLHVKKLFQSQNAFPFQYIETLTEQFLKYLPFKLTKSQQRVLNEILQDLMQPHPMLRLIQGDVGSGKTVVAALAMFHIVKNNYQAALMVPTEILAEQHYQTFQAWFEPFDIQVVLLTGRMDRSEKKSILNSIKQGKAKIILGSHVLFQAPVEFKNLTLIVTDEQHRFGVVQRAQLLEKGLDAKFFPHQLMMSATPIPRTLAMSFYANLDSSVLDEKPPNRIAIATSVLPNTKRNAIIERIKKICLKGQQVYWVCPLIDESETLQVEAASIKVCELQRALPELRIGLIHGRMKSNEKEMAMKQFQEHSIQLLVATTIIEVGMDVPNATVMIIENSERLGLAQLHQLRGRVGRGQLESYCLLLYQAPLSAIARERLNVMRETNDGFKIAEKDLALRGPGEVLGTKQKGDLVFKTADIVRDHELLASVQQLSDYIIKNSPELMGPLIERWVGNKVFRTV